MLTSDTFPKRFLFVDTETHIVGDEKVYVEFPLRLGCAIYLELDDNLKPKKRHVIRFNSIEQFLTIVEQYTKQKSKLFLFAHNWQFDLQVLQLPYIFKDNGYQSEPPIINERLFIWTVKAPKGTLVFLDTANYAVISVKQLGLDFGMNKGEVDFHTEDDDLLFEYCKRDTEIIEHFVREYLTFIVENELGQFKYSLAGQALTAWRTKFMQQSIFIHNHQEALQLERAAYHGGRVECLWIGKPPGDKFYYLDVNSMYPFVMRNFKLPYKPAEYKVKPKLPYVHSRFAKYYIIADVTIDTDNPAYPIIEKNKLIFPVGRFRTVLHQPELEYAFQHGDIVEYHAAVFYHKAILFDRYVDFFYHTKQEATKSGNKSWRWIAKIFLNSLYGKLGQTDTSRQMIGKDKNTGLWRLTGFNTVEGKRFTEIGWFGEIYRETKGGEVAYSAPSVAGAITAYARYTLYSFAEQAGLANTYYMDTDSLIVNHAGYLNLKPLINDIELGMLKLEHESNHLVIYGNKDYEFGSDIKLKGVPAKAEKLEDNKWGYLQFQSLLAALNIGMQKPPSAKYIIKRRLARYDKGIVLDNGKVIPKTITVS